MEDKNIEMQYDKHYSSANYKHEATLTSLLTEILEYCKSGTALDLGAGPGQNSLFLAENGFLVTAVDISCESLNHIRDFSGDKDIILRKENIKEMNIIEDYTVIMCARTLEHFTKDERERFFLSIKKHTQKGGFNLISAYTTKTNETEVSYPDLILHILPEDELKNIYHDWEIIGIENKKIVHKTDSPIYLKTIQTILVRNNPEPE